MNESITTASGIISALEEKPYFRVIKTIPEGLAPQIESAVVDFIKTSHLPAGVDRGGFYNQTLQAMASATVLNQGGEMWIGTARGELLTYVMAHIGNDFDGRLSYHVSQAWVKKGFRATPLVKSWWGQIKSRAKDLMCGHLVITSSRNPKAYERWFGDGMAIYATLLKMNL